jgi:Ser/Thr protein kinase RdoA (MazF antagonist)
LWAVSLNPRTSNIAIIELGRGKREGSAASVNGNIASVQSVTPNVSAQSLPFATLSPDLVLSAVESLGYAADARVFALNSYENRVYQVGLEDGSSLVVKFYRPRRWSDAQIREEHSFLAELNALEIPVGAPIIRDEETIFVYEGFRFSIFERLAGRAVNLENPDDLVSMGRFVARIHAVGARARYAHRSELSIERLGNESREFLLQSGFLEGDLQRAYETLSADLLNEIALRFDAHGPLRSLRLHGDCHMGNVLWREDTPHFVDFDDTMMGPAIQDLWMMLSGDRNQQQAQLIELVEGYNEFYDFVPSELSLIESLRALRLMHYSAWLGRRWSDPAFPLSFPWFNTQRYWAEHILELREQFALLDEPPLRLI